MCMYSEGNVCHSIYQIQGVSHQQMPNTGYGGVVTTSSPGYKEGVKGARLGPAARLGPQPPGVRLTHRYVHRGIDDEILAKGK